jgi:uncharacterized protein YndB with AHSA1/START domain
MESNIKGRELFISRMLNAPIELVWEVWTKPEHIAQWWGPNGFTNIISIMDMQAGGEWNLIMHGPDGTDYPNKSTFREVIPLKRIAYEHLHPHFIATINFEEQGDKTLLNWHVVFDSKEILKALIQSNNVAEGLKQNVEKLSAYLSAMANK